MCVYECVLAICVTSAAKSLFCFFFIFSPFFYSGCSCLAVLTCWGRRSLCRLCFRPPHEFTRFLYTVSRLAFALFALAVLFDLLLPLPQMTSLSLWLCRPPPRALASCGCLATRRDAHAVRQAVNADVANRASYTLYSGAWRAVWAMWVCVDMSKLHPERDRERCVSLRRMSTRYEKQVCGKLRSKKSRNANKKLSIKVKSNFYKYSIVRHIK